MSQLLAEGDVMEPITRLEEDGVLIVVQFQQRIVRARKAHACESCSRVIAKGDLFEEVWCWWGRYDTVRYCMECGLCDGVPMHWSTFLQEQGQSVMEILARRRGRSWGSDEPAVS